MSNTNLQSPPQCQTMPDHTFNCGTVVLRQSKEGNDSFKLWFEDADGKKLKLHDAYLRLYGYYSGLRGGERFKTIWKGYEKDGTELRMNDSERDTFMSHFSCCRAVKMDYLCPCQDPACHTCAQVIAKRLARGQSEQKSTEWVILF